MLRPRNLSSLSHPADEDQCRKLQRSKLARLRQHASINTGLFFISTTAVIVPGNGGRVVCVGASSQHLVRAKLGTYVANFILKWTSSGEGKQKLAVFSL